MQSPPAQFFFSARRVGEQTSTELHYYISSLGETDAASLLTMTRQHWGVENGLHWVLDV